MKPSILPVFVLLLLFACSKEEEPFPGRTVETYSNEGFMRFNPDWNGVDMILETDGSLIVAGNARTINANLVVQPFVLKLDTEKNTVWSYFSSLDQGNFYRPLTFIPAKNDRYSLVTYSDPEGNNEFGLNLLSFSSNGILNWQRDFNEDGFIEQTSSVIQLENGDHLILSMLKEGLRFFEDKFLLLRVSENGELIWSKIIEEERISSTKQLIYLSSDNSLLVLTEHKDASNPLVTFLKIHKFDEDGNKIWTKAIDTVSPSIYPNSSLLKVMKGGEIYLTYSSDFFESNLETVVLKLNADADIIWEQVTPNQSTNITEDIVQTRDGNLVLLSSSANIESRGFDVMISNLNSSDGAINWEKNYGSTSSDFGRAIVQRENGNLVIMGTTNHENISDAIFDFFILETDDQGNPI